jgi:hypothetical protein
VTLVGDQIAASATDEYASDGLLIYCVWLLSDDDHPEGFESRIAATSMGAAIDAFADMVQQHRMKSFSWKGKARALRSVK